MTQLNPLISDYEEVPADFELVWPHTCLVQPIRPRGMLGDLEIIQDDEGSSAKTTMFLRVVQLGPENGANVKLGAVYVCPVYCYDELVYNGETFYITDDRNLKAEIEGYDTCQYTE